LYLKKASIWLLILHLLFGEYNFVVDELEKVEKYLLSKFSHKFSIVKKRTKIRFFLNGDCCVNRNGENTTNNSFIMDIKIGWISRFKTSLNVWALLKHKILIYYLKWSADILSKGENYCFWKSNTQTTKDKF
jgi:hypothetical protein